MTPEGKVKAAVNRLLEKYKGIYKFMPVPGGFGASSLDYLLCVNGRFVSIETKAPGKKPTDRQKMVIGQIVRAGGMAFVIDGADSLSTLRDYLERVTNAPHPDQPAPQSYRRALAGGCSEPVSDREANDDVRDADACGPTRAD
jgi:hypothetical protein